MDNLEALSDNELRHRLLQYGFPNLPVTDTTRKILIKKLRNHMTNEKAKLRRETNYAARYSSDDESGTDSKKNKKGKASIVPSVRTKTFNNNVMPPPASTNISRRVTTVSSNRTSFNNIHTPPPRPSSRIYVPPPILANDTDEDSDYYSYKPKNSIGNRLSNSPNISNAAVYNYTPDKSDGETSWSKGRLSSSPTYTAENYFNSNGHGSINDSPYPNDFTRRLLNLRGETIRDSIYRSDIKPRLTRTSLSPLSPDPAEIVHQQPEPRTEFNISPSVAFSNLINRLDEQYGVKQTLIPCALLSALIVFFALVAFMYMTISPDLANTISEKNTHYNVCDPRSSTSTKIATSTYTCIENGALDDALGLLRLMAPELQKRAEENRCSDNTAPFTMSAKEIVRLAQKRNTFDVRKTIKDLHNVEYLIEQNPQWKINHVDSNGAPIGFEKLVQLRNTQSNHYAILDPRLPFTCSMYNKFQKFFLFVGSIGVFILGALGLYLLYRLFVKYQQSKRDAVAFFIDEIISNLMRKAAVDPDQSSIVVNHLRDKLIPLHKRKSLDWAWKEAIKYLEQNESRIQFEMGMRNGEDCKLMRWIDTVSPEQIGQRSPVKKWHSPAFDKTNKISNPPTPCLKIRQMFDKFEANNPNLKTIIQDAILEKVGPNCKIYDIQLDKQTCCVYVRCASPRDAGIVHDEINGWWFDKRLVSIKFLRLERYLNRFPKASSGPTCLHPSNTKNLSMSQCSRGLGAVNGIEDDDYDEEIDEDS